MANSSSRRRGTSGRDTLLIDLGKVLDLADRLLGEIDRVGEVVAPPPIDMVSDMLRTIRPLGDGDVADPRTVASRILVVDDNTSNRDLLSRRLVREGYCVRAAETGAEALALTTAEGFDLVLLGADRRRPLFERDQRILELLKRSAQPAIKSGDFEGDALELKLISLMHLCQAWAIRRWILSEYSTVEEYLDDLESIALGMMRATRIRKGRRRTA